MKDLSQRIAALTPEQRALFQERLKQHGLAGKVTDIVPKRLSRTHAATSFAQRRLWFLDRLVPANPAYNVRSVLQLDGTLDIPLLERCLNIIVSRHEVLRTVFRTIDGHPVQVLTPPAPLALPIIDITPGQRSFPAELAIKLAAEEGAQPFDLVQGPLLRVVLVRCHAERHVLIVTMHHIIADGWSVQVFFRELTRLYQAHGQEEGVLPPLPIQYADFAEWQETWLQTGVLQEQLTYWRQQLADVPETLALPLDRPYPRLQTFRGGHVPFTLSASMTQALRSVGRACNATLFMMLLAVYSFLLHCYTEQTDIVVGSPVANRGRPELEGLIGLFVNTLPLRITFTGQPSFVEFLKSVRQTCLAAYAHQDVPFEKLIGDLHIKRDLRHQPLFQVVFVLQSGPRWLMELSDLVMSRLEVEIEAAKFDLVLDVTELQHSLSGVWEYNADIFTRETMEDLSENFVALLWQVVESPERRLDELKTFLLDRLARQRSRRLAERREQNRASLQRLRSRP
jgi:hypothetical protein